MKLIRAIFTMLACALPCNSVATVVGNCEIDWTEKPAVSVVAKIEKAVQSVSGSVVTEHHLTRSIQTLLDILTSAGYKSATIDPGAFALRGDSLNFRLQIAPGPLAAIKRWEFAGLRRTDTAWLAHVVDWPVGIAATQQAIASAMNSLQTIGQLTATARPDIQFNDHDSTVVVRFHLREPSAAVVEGAFAAASQASGDGPFLGQLSMSMNTLFRRDRTLNLRYEHPGPDERLTHLQFADRHSLVDRVRLNIEMEDWRQREHRQRASLESGWMIHKHLGWEISSSLSWNKVNPLSQSSTYSVRIYDAGLGISLGSPLGNLTHARIRLIYSLHRSWWPEIVANERVRFELDMKHSIVRGESMKVTAAAGARWWGGESSVGSGDEWYLGGEVLRGYQSRAIAAHSGVWTGVEASHLSQRGIGFGAFGEAAWLRPVANGDGLRPLSYGAFVLLRSSSRQGRLEFAWRDHVSWRDGILRFSITQGW